jgi:hypothetical protein
MIKMSFFVFLFLAILCSGFVFAKDSSAVDASKFKAGLIISDSTFTNSNSMTTAQIQSFLESKNPSCDTNGQQLSEFGGPDLNGDGKVQRWEWGKQNYNQTVFTCLKDYTENNKTAAQIIYENSQTYKINPQVLIVLLQKEQALITDSWPLSLQYRSATGYGCPDTAACDSQYYGLTNQIKWSATMFRAIMNDSPTWYTPYEVGVNSIPWHPNTSACGYSSINIENRATQSLYNYTPYRPNQSALNSGYGSGDSCASYGNRNFYLYFSDWFGSPTSPFDMKVQAVTAYSDGGYQTPITLTDGKYNVAPGQIIYIKVDVKNIGSEPLSSNFTRIGTASPRDRSSAYTDGTWINYKRPTALSQPILYTGQSGFFDFSLSMPREINATMEKFGIVAEGRKWILDDGIEVPINIVATANYDVAISSHALYLDPGRTIPAPKTPILRAGQSLYGETTITNIGKNTLASASTKIAPTSPRDRAASKLIDGSWISPTRISTIDKNIATGETGITSYTLTPSATSGSYTEQFGFLSESNAWLDTEKVTVNFKFSTDGPVIIYGETLQLGDILRKNEFRLVLQGDGNLVLYKGGTALWSTRTNGSGAARLVLQGDGNLVLYKGGTALWSTRTNGSGAARLVLQGDGNLVLYSSKGTPTWSSRTVQR